MRPIVTDNARGLCVCVRVCVCLLDIHDHELCQSGGTDRAAVWDVDPGGPREPCIRWVGASIPARERVVIEHISKTHSLYSSLFSTPVAINNYNNNSDNYNSRKLNYKHLINNYMLLQNWKKPLAVEIYRNINLSFPLLRTQLGRSITEQLW